MALFALSAVLGNAHKVGTTTGRLHPPADMPEGMDLSPDDLKALEYWQVGSPSTQARSQC